MCNQPDCNHTHDVTLTPRDRKLAHAFFATMAMSMVVVNKSEEQGDEMLAHASCAQSCEDEACPRRKLMDDALAQAVNHVDHGAPLPAYHMVKGVARVLDEGFTGFVIVSTNPVTLRPVFDAADPLADAGVPKVVEPTRAGALDMLDLPDAATITDARRRTRLLN